MIDFYACTLETILIKRRTLKKELLQNDALRELRIGILGGSTTDEVANLTEILLLSEGFLPVFHTGEYGRFYEEAVHDPQELIDFKPQLVYLHTSFLNVRNLPPINCTEADLPGYVELELQRFREIWDALDANIGCQIIQNNFELPPVALLGNMDAVAAGGRTRFLLMLNLAFAQEAARRPRLLIQDIHSISAQVGLRQWFNWDRYFAYKILLTSEANLELARSLTALVRAMYGRSRKVLVLDLDNTLWGGVIGDDGVEKIQIGRETPIGESYTAFQEYCLALRNRGVLLAACSKNTRSIAITGFEHPSSILKLEHFSSFKANWEPKHENILAIAQELNLGVDSFVFIDDNPAERAIVQAQLPAVAVPDVGSEVTRFAEFIDRGRYFEPATLSKEDLERAALYATNNQRQAQQTKFADYGEYLDSLEMTAEIEPFKPVYLDRIAQLTNKSNQFNLTTRRYTLGEIEAASRNPDVLGLYGRLIDRFGDNGLISVVLGTRAGDILVMDLWLMSCRVLKRDMEHAMLDAVVERAAAMGIRTIVGTYLPTAKNAMVADFYARLGFTPRACPPDLPAGTTFWELAVAGYQIQNHHIQVLEPVHA